MKYPANLCDLSHEERQAIGEDKALWLECYKAVRQLSVEQIKEKLSAIDCEVTRVDLQMRLNTCYKNMRDGYKFF